jgi:hypothetical protein
MNVVFGNRESMSMSHIGVHSSSRNRPSLAIIMGTGALLFLGAVTFGLLASTANPILIGLGCGVLGGALLLAIPKWAVWLVLALGLSTGALISVAGPAYSKLPWAISMLAFLLWPPALARLTQQQHVPAFIWLALAFVLETVLSTAVQWYSAAEFAAGFKRYFQAYGLLFALALLAFSREEFLRWKVLLLGIALLQLPFALYEFVVLVPMRGGLEAGGEATDVVAGTLGANIEGGSANAEMATFLLIVVAFLMSRWREGLLSTTKCLVLSMVCLLPLGLGETKIVVIMLPLIGMVLLRHDFVKAPFRYLPGLIALALVTMLLGEIYLTVMLDTTLEEAVQGTLRYNLQDQGHGLNYLNRTTVLSFWWSLQGWHDPLGFLFGHGLGSSFSSFNNPVVGHVAMRYPRYGINLTTASTLLWDTGLFGLTLYVAILTAAWVAANRLWAAARDAAVRADVLAIQAAIALFMLHVIYRNSLVNLLPFELIVAAILGYLAFLIRNQGIVFPDRCALPREPGRNLR